VIGTKKNDRSFCAGHYFPGPLPVALGANLRAPGAAVHGAPTFVESCAMEAPHALDRLDRAILRCLQANGRETYDVIGEQVGLSPSAVLRRVKRLEDAGVIDRYVALVQPEAVGLGLTAYLNVRLEKHTESHKRNPMDLFRASVQTWPEVVECAALTGEMDYLLRVVVADMAHYSRFIMDTLLKHPSVQDCKTSFVLDRVKATTAVPL
jgi:Lrp/AsnC family transcriptional regulator, leucine-responsive regulatory protein